MIGNNLFNLILVVLHECSINTVHNIWIVLLDSNDMILAQYTIVLCLCIPCLPIMLIKHLRNTHGSLLVVP